MEPNRFTTSSHDDKWFYAWFGSAIAAVLICALSFAKQNLWLFWVVTLTLTVGLWFQYFVTRIWPRIWTIEVGQDSLRYFRNGELVDEVLRTEAIGVRRDHGTKWWLWQEFPSVKIDLRDRRVHHVSGLRLAFGDQEAFVDAVARQWELPATQD